MASLLNKLPDADLEAICHMIRRDAGSDREVARKAEEFAAIAKLRGASGPWSLGPTDHAKEAVISRFRAGAWYKRWLTRWENQDIELRKALEGQKQRYALVREILGPDKAEGAGNVSRAILARGLAMAAEMTDDDYCTALSGKGFLANLIRLVQSQEKAERTVLREKVLGAVGDASKANATPEQLVAAVDKVMGLA